MDHVPKIAMRAQVFEELRAIFAAKNRQDAELLRQMVESYAKSAPSLATWLETNIPEGLNCFELPKAHQKRLRTTNMVERVNQELKRSTRLIRIFPNVDSLTLLRGLEGVKKGNPLIFRVCVFKVGTTPARHSGVLPEN
jgi:putative transposase